MGYYATWLEYFDSLLHNAIFSNTAYEFSGFTAMPGQVNEIALYAVVNGHTLFQADWQNWKK